MNADLVAAPDELQPSADHLRRLLDP